jgi:ribosomal protein S18 acetylase RimI-like enzyme
MIHDDAAALAVGRLHLNGPEEAQVRYMAVDPAFQGQGLGGRLLGELENQARYQGVQRIVLNARANAVGFYTHLGYEIIGPGETLFGEIRHTKMRKVLGAPASHTKYS